MFDLLSLPNSFAKLQRCSVRVSKQWPVPHTCPSSPQLVARQVLVFIQSLARFLSDGSVGKFSLCFFPFKTSKWWITAKSCRLSSSLFSSSTSAVRSHIEPAFGFGQYDGFISFHIVPRTTLRVSLPLHFGNRGSDHSLLQNYSQLQLFRRYHPHFPSSLHPEVEDYRLLKDKVRIPSFFVDEWVMAHLTHMDMDYGTPDTYWKHFSFPYGA